MTLTPETSAAAQGNRTRVIALSVVWISAVAFVLIAFVEALPLGPGAATAAFVDMALVTPSISVGVLLVHRLPRHIIGWLLLFGSYSLAVTAVAAALADYGLNQHPGSVPGAIWWAILASAAGGIFIGLLGGFVPLYFPTGRLLSDRWRIVVPIAVVATFMPVVTSVFGPLPPDTYPPSVVNPLVLDGIGGQVIAFLGGVSYLTGVVALVCVVASVVVRYRRARGVERAQIKWFAYLGLVFVPMLLIAFSVEGAPAGPLTTVSDVAWIIGLLALTLLPVTIGIAILRYRLYEIDRLVSRTISWAVITVILGSSFVLVVLIAQVLIAPVTGSSELAVAGSTLFVFALFQPVRRRVQRVVDRRFNRARYDADRTVSAFAARLRDEVDLEHLRTEILATVTETVEPSRISLWLRQ